MDTLPSLPEMESIRRILQARMKQAGVADQLASDVAELALAITDNTLPEYRVRTEHWPISNPEGYAIWFESRMRLARHLLETRAIQAKVAKVDDLPVYKWKTPLQLVIHILKRHRDVVFEQDQERKPISIIITTLAAKAYNGESDLSLATEQILSNMEMEINSTQPRVPNPVNPIEDFADKWEKPEGRRLHLKENFFRWLAHAKADIQKILTSSDKGFIREQAIEAFGITLDETILGAIIGLSTKVTSPPDIHIISSPPPKPWCR